VQKEDLSLLRGGLGIRWTKGHAHPQRDEQKANFFRRRKNILTDAHGFSLFLSKKGCSYPKGKL